MTQMLVGLGLRGKRSLGPLTPPPWHIAAALNKELSLAVIIVRISSQFKSKAGNFDISRTQFPLLLCWAVTVHKVSPGK
jgi:hypothetical protein